jgi:hypothetical protein
MPSTPPTPNTTEPVVLKTLKGVKTQKGESSSHVTLSRSLQACCMAPSPVWTAGLDWQCSKLEVHGSDMGQHDPGRGPRSQDGPCQSLESLRANYRMGFGNSAQTAERRWGPPRPLQGSALSSPWTLASKVTNPRGLGRRLGPIRQVRRDCLGGAKPHFPPRFRASDSHPPDVAPILRGGAKPLFVRRNSSSPRRPAHNRALCTELNIRSQLKEPTQEL